MIKGVAGQVAGGQMTNATTGADFAGTVTVYVTGDGGTQAIGTVGSGLCTNEGHGYYTYAPSQAETNYDVAAFTFVGTGAISTTTQYPTILYSQQLALQTLTVPGSISFRDLLTNILFDLEVLQAGEVATADDAALAMESANEFLESMSLDNLTIYAVTRTLFPFTGASSYTIGAGGTINIARPVNPQSIQNISFLDNSLTTPIETPLGPPLTEDQYASLSYKTMTSAYPSRLYYSATYPFGTLIPWPIVPTGQVYGVLYTQTAVPTFGSLNDVITLPPGYKRFLRKNIAVEIAPSFGATATPELIAAADESKAQIKRANMRLTDLSCGESALLFGGGRRYGYNIYTDQG